MKVNQSFNAGATKKISTENALEKAINSNFTNSTSETSNSTNSSVLTSESSQNSVILANSQTSSQSSNSANSENSTSNSATLSSKTQNLENSNSENQQKQSKKNLSREKSDTFPVYLAQGERAPYKAFCAIQNVSMNHFVVCAMDYFKQEIENGKVEITKHGYKRR